MDEFPPAIFVTGTDTNVGKTVVSAILTLGLKAKYWKPVQAGTLPMTDCQWIAKVTQLPSQHFLPESYQLAQALAPHLAAEMEGIIIDPQKISLPSESSSSHLIVEGAGGIMVPLNSKFMIIDLIEHLNLPILLVARSTLGTINHTLLTLDKLQQRKLKVLGVVMNGVPNPNNRQAIEKFGQTKVIAEIEPLKQLNREKLLQSYDTHFSKYHLRPNCAEMRTGTTTC